MDMFDFAGLLFGGSRTAPDAKTVTATGAGASAGGEVGITLDADVTPAEDTGVEGDEDQTIIDLPTSPDVAEGDELIVTLVGDGPLKTPVVTANPGSGDRMRALANSAKTIADAAQAVAEAVNQHFFADGGGIHVTEATQEDWDENHSGANVLINSIGQLFRDGLNNLLTLTTENGARALTIWDGLGNAASNVRAVIGETIQLGKSAEPHVTIDSGSMGFWASAAQLAMRFTGRKVDYPSNSTYFAAIEDGVTRENDPDPYEDEHSYIYLRTTESPTYQGSDEKVVTESEVTLRAYVRDGDSTYISLTNSKDVNATKPTRVATVFTDRVAYSTSNGDNEWSTPAGTVLWSASSGWAMAANVTANLSHNVSTCPSGIVLHWQAYASGSVQNYAHVYTFVPKQHVVANAGGGVTCQLAHSAFSQVGTKYVYVNDGSIAGNAANTQSGTANGITYNNGYWVLTQVISA